MTEVSVFAEILSERPEGITSLFIRGWKKDVDIGVLSHEKGVLQPVSFDIEVHISGSSAPVRDEIDAVVDYDYLRSLVDRLLESRRFNLLETLASEILEGCLAPPEVIASTVSVSKLSVIEGDGEIGCTFSRVKESFAKNSN
ncbi:MAG TPA: dihydroneopterin aldolase [Candidatus Thalassarchaeaceae archaeon]|nr:dihydroneopterin aldolase [Candidatus Thalassarchaeaceae archaeon]